MQVRGLPHYASGLIVKGFGRGSADLGIPTANFALDVVQQLPPDFVTGIYYGWASVNNGDVHKMVISIGWNPFYNNKEKSMETHIMHKFNGNLYDSLLKICICGFIRPEKNFDSLDALIEQINADIDEANTALDGDEHRTTRESDFFTSVTGNVTQKEQH